MSGVPKFSPMAAGHPRDSRERATGARGATDTASPIMMNGRPVVAARLAETVGLAAATATAVATIRQQSAPPKGARAKATPDMAALSFPLHPFRPAMARSTIRAVRPSTDGPHHLVTSTFPVFMPAGEATRRQ
jgi:hypothetical protein